MSPTSYQTAPPRILIIKVHEHQVNATTLVAKLPAPTQASGSHLRSEDDAGSHNATANLIRSTSLANLRGHAFAPRGEATVCQRLEFQSICLLRIEFGRNKGRD
jgi:hypothetical protein